MVPELPTFFRHPTPSPQRFPSAPVDAPSSAAFTRACCPRRVPRTAEVPDLAGDGDPFAVVRPALCIGLQGLERHRHSGGNSDEGALKWVRKVSWSGGRWWEMWGIHEFGVQAISKQVVNCDGSVSYTPLRLPCRLPFINMEPYGTPKPKTNGFCGFASGLSLSLRLSMAVWTSPGFHVRGTGRSEKNWAPPKVPRGKTLRAPCPGE